MPLPPFDQLPEAVTEAARKFISLGAVNAAWWETLIKWVLGGGLIAFLMRMIQWRTERARAFAIEARAEDQRVATAGRVAGYYRELLDEITKMRKEDALRYEKHIADDRARFDKILAEEQKHCAGRTDALQMALNETTAKCLALERRMRELEIGCSNCLLATPRKDRVS